MKEIPISKKIKVIKLFLAGLSYDEIVIQTGISKGSIVNIINDFRDGKIPVPAGMAEYIDELRYVAVEMKKHNTTVGHLKGYLKIHSKIEEMGVDSQQVDLWLDTCQGIASPTVANKELIAAAIQLAQFKKAMGYDYQSLIEDYKAKIEELKFIEGQINKKGKELSEIEQQMKSEKQQTTKELGSITKAIATAQETFAKQKAELKSHIDEYVAQNQLSWEKVNKVLAIIHAELSKVGLEKDEEEAIAKEIAEIGSMIVYKKNIESQNKELESNRNQLAKEKKELSGYITGHQGVLNQLSGEMLKKTKQRAELNNQLKLKHTQLSRLGELLASYSTDIYACRLVLGFLSAPNLFSDYDFDQMAKMVLALRQIRLGVAPMRLMDDKGNVLCQCPIPEQYIPFEKYGVTIDQAKERLAMYLFPLIKDKFIPRSEYLQAKLNQEVTELRGMYRQLTNALSGFPIATDESAGISGPSEQETADTAEQYHDLVDSDANILEHSEPKQDGSYYGSAETERAKMETDKKFLESISGL